MGKTSLISSKDSYRITAIMPVYNGARFIVRSLDPLLGMMSRGEILEVLVVDDNSTDNSAEVAGSLGARVLHTRERSGPGAARNLAAKLASGDILWFIDADVIVHADAGCRVAESFSDPTVAAVFGSYDDRPPARNFLSQYKNLVHRYYHQQGRREASTFWAGCGAVRRTQFLDVGGFDTQRYDRPSIEDIELGYRLRSCGQRVVLNPLVEGTHLKHWSFFNLIHTEIFRRAIPWSRLILQSEGLINDLNVSVAERLRAALSCLLVFSCAAAILSLVNWWIPFLVLLALVAANWQLMRYFLERKGILFAIKAILFHQLYYFYSTAAYIWTWLEYQVSRVVRSS